MLRSFSPGVWLVLLLALGSTLLIAFLPIAPRPGMDLWVFDRNHAETANLIAADWNRAHPEIPVQVSLLAGGAIQARMLSAFYSDTPVGDMIEVERSMIGQIFAGPIEDVGFTDLTGRLNCGGLRDKINAPSFSPWTRQGHVFGLPHDVHPVMLLYRSDLVEAAGIDVSQIETWDDYFRLMRPLQVDLDGDGRPDRYLLASSPTNLFNHELLLMQAGGGFFDANARPTLNAPLNARVIARLATWYAGPGRVTNEATAGTASALRLILDGYVVGILCPDWMAGTLRTSLPELAGKFKFMPLPAWEKGGRRTSVLGGTMLGITKASPHQEAAWAFAQQLYLSPTTAARLFEHALIVTPIKANWSAAIYDRPDPYFSKQPVGRMFINLAPDVPVRTSSPFYTQAQGAFNLAVIQLCHYTDAHHISDPALLVPEAQRLLDGAQAELLRLIHRNIFLRPASP